MNPDYKNKHLVFFDLETKRGSAQVGWSRIHCMGMSLAVTYSERDGYQTFLHHEVESLISYLKSADAVVGFNHIEFDYKVLSAYTDDDLSALNNIDMFLVIYNKIHRRISLNKLAQGCLGRSKSGDGLDALRWYKEGRIDLIEKYCREDVAITRDLYYRGCEKGYVSYLHQGRTIDVTVDWSSYLDRIETVDIPSQNSLNRDFLQTIHELNEEFELYDAIVKVAQYHGLDLETDSPDGFSIREERLFKAIQNTFLGLARDKCVEQSRPGFWKITIKGTEKLGISDRVHDRDRAFGQPILHAPSKALKLCCEPYTPPKSRKYVRESKKERNLTPQIDNGTSSETPTPNSIKIPLLQIIQKMGGEIELCQATEKIAEYLGTLLTSIEKFGGTHIPNTEKGLLELMQNSANLLWFDDYLKPIRSGVWKITAKGINRLRSSNNIR